MKDKPDFIPCTTGTGGAHRGTGSDWIKAAGIGRNSGRSCRIGGGLCAATVLLTLVLWGCKGKEAENPVSVKTDSTLENLVSKVGGPFPYTRFIGDDGEVVDLARASDRKYSLVVFMRGFAGFVCPYCTAQTAELLDRHHEIMSTQTQLFIVYPGPADTIPKFLDAVRAYMKSDDDSALAVPLLMDVDLKAVDALGIRHQLARPSSFVLDANGTLVYAYVGKSPSDRPALDDILRVLKTAPDGDETDGKSSAI
jgi:peroxiredoxin